MHSNPDTYRCFLCVLNDLCFLSTDPGSGAASPGDGATQSFRSAQGQEGHGGGRGKVKAEYNTLSQGQGISPRSTLNILGSDLCLYGGP